MRRSSKALPIFLPLLLLAFCTFLFRYSNFDRIASAPFYGGANSWPMTESQPFQFLYEYGTFPAWMMAYAGIVIWLVGLIWHRGLARRAFFCTMVVVIGPGLIVNGILKPNWCRPRPCQLVEFGGENQFQSVLSLGATDAVTVDLAASVEVTDQLEATESLIPAEPLRSFPSGHASMGFALIAPALLARRRRWFSLAIGASIGYGLLIGITRIVQGRHYPSDVLWSAAIVYFTAATLYWLIGLHGESFLWPQSPQFDDAGRLISLPISSRHAENSAESREPESPPADANEFDIGKVA